MTNSYVQLNKKQDNAKWILNALIASLSFCEDKLRSAATSSGYNLQLPRDHDYNTLMMISSLLI